MSRTHDRLALHLLKHDRDNPSSGQSQGPLIQQHKEKLHVPSSVLYRRHRLTQGVVLGNEITHNLEGHQQVAGIFLPIHDLDETEGEVGTQTLQLCKEEECE